ncbi:MAG: NAD-dependent epimerase/dehydratase family protein [Pseudomonadales bacterium]|nr:NAD-dependent epimerase/dehydratase family protein [Pseudomonadales bacterium]
MKKNRCVVYGATGFIGGYLVNELIRNEYYVVAVGRNTEKLHKKFGNLTNSLEIKACDFKDTTKSISFLREYDIVFDLVASSVPVTSVKMPIEEIQNNIEPQADFFMRACEKKVSKIIFTSSGGSIYGDMGDKPFSETDLPNPQSPHAIGKLSTEYFLKYFCSIAHLPFTIFRVSNPFGMGQEKTEGFGVIPTFLEGIRTNTPPTLFGEGNLVRDFIHVQDLVEAIVLSLYKDNNYFIYNIGNGSGLKIREVWDVIKEASGTNLVPILKESRSFDIKKIVLDISRFSNEFTWKPKTDVKESISKLARSIKNY